ncbi:MAG: ABC transporter ATP-binding protein [Chloroflexota bacterium]|nr:ABC transporter ATP-binding protein [Chloroflexota bacterium]MDE2884577.1 ABC transporter ATP-binding protein [Chloroflexota bacterium]
MASVIEVTDLRKTYRLGALNVPVLNGVSMSVERGEMVCIMGPSGSGKSTLMNIIGCLDAPTSGSYRLEGEEVSRWGDARLAAARNSKIGFVFQTYNLLARLSALANVELALQYGDRRNARARSLQALESVGLGHRYKHRPLELSGGEQQRVAIARALVKNPAIMLADEPTGALDSRSSAEIMAILQRLNRDEGLTVALVTHEADIARHTRRIVSLRDGLVVSDEPVAEPLQAQAAEGVSA